MIVFRDSAAVDEEIAGMDTTLNGMMQSLKGTHPRNSRKTFQRTTGTYANMLKYTMTGTGCI